ncbi:leucine-rich repeat domain-containing protein [Breznakiellaceae bacterium SP9]
MRKYSFVLLFLVLSLASLAAQTTDPSEFEFTVEVNGEITITKYVGTKASVEIPQSIDDKPVTTIGAWAFSLNTNLVSVIIPQGVTAIEDGAFFTCINLASVTIPEGVISIGERAFSYCRALESVSIPESLTSIGAWAFAWCSSVSDVRLPASIAIDDIEPYALAGTKRLPAEIVNYLKEQGLESVFYTVSAAAAEGWINN